MTDFEMRNARIKDFEKESKRKIDEIKTYCEKSKLFEGYKTLNTDEVNYYQFSSNEKAGYQKELLNGEIVEVLFGIDNIEERIIILSRQRRGIYVTNNSPFSVDLNVDVSKIFIKN